MLLLPGKQVPETKGHKVRVQRSGQRGHSNSSVHTTTNAMSWWGSFCMSWNTGWDVQGLTWKEVMSWILIICWCVYDGIWCSVNQPCQRCMNEMSSWVRSWFHTLVWWHDYKLSCIYIHMHGTVYSLDLLHDVSNVDEELSMLLMELIILLVNVKLTFTVSLVEALQNYIRRTWRSKQGPAPEVCPGGLIWDEGCGDWREPQTADCWTEQNITLTHDDMEAASVKHNQGSGRRLGLLFPACSPRFGSSWVISGNEAGGETGSQAGRRSAHACY